MIWKKWKIDKRKDYFLPGTSILHQAEMTNVKALSTLGPQSSQNLGIISHTKPNLVNLDLILHLAQRSCHCWKYPWKTSIGMTMALYIAFCWIDALEVKKCPYSPILRLRKCQNLQNEIWKIQWLRYGWNLVLQQKMLNCEVGVTKCIVMVLILTVSPFNQPFLLLNMRYKFWSLVAHSP